MTCLICGIELKEHKLSGHFGATVRKRFHPEHDCPLAHLDLNESVWKAFEQAIRRILNEQIQQG